MSNLSLEAQALRDRISRYFEPTREELDRILKLEFQFVQLLDLILRLYPLDASTQDAIARLEESRSWAGLSVKRGQQLGYQPSHYSPASDMNTILCRCIPNREMDLALARLHEAKVALNLGASSLSSMGH
jgi:hypothetical protein